MSLYSARSLVRTAVSLSAIVVCLLPQQHLFAQQDSGEAARALLDKYKGSLVVVTAESKVITTTDADPLPTKTQQRRTLGTTVFPNGLIVCSNSALGAAKGQDQ